MLNFKQSFQNKIKNSNINTNSCKSNMEIKKLQSRILANLHFTLVISDFLQRSSSSKSWLKLALQLSCLIFDGLCLPCMGETEKFSKRGKNFLEKFVPKAMAERSSRQRRERGAVPKAQATTRGVRGHAPPEKFWIPDANLCNLVPSDQLFYSFKWRNFPRKFSRIFFFY